MSFSSLRLSRFPMLCASFSIALHGVHDFKATNLALQSGLHVLSACGPQTLTGHKVESLWEGITQDTYLAF